MRLLLLRVSVLLPLLLLLSLGCTKGPGKLVPVSGRVMMDGKPLVNATVTFAPLNKSEGSASDAIGTTDDTGRYTLQTLFTGQSLDGAVVGKHKVRIALFDRSAVVNVEGKTKVGVELVPSRYNTGSTMEFTVPPEGTDKADFLDLSSKPDPGEKIRRER
jgi:hypothetical protein